MIYLDPPYRVIDGYTILSDHADPSLFYVLPSAPAVATEPDGRPLFSLLQYQGGGAGAQKVEGGLLTLTTQLHMGDAELTRLRGRLASSGALAGRDIRLTPVLFDSGTVELVALGATSGAAGRDEPGGAGAAGPFEIRFLGSGQPSLDGDNQATFQLVLDAMAAELIAATLEAPDLPLIVIYRMGFAGLRPSFHIDVQADWSKVYSSLKNRASANIWIVAADAESLITSTLEENGITIHTDVFGVGDEARGRAERARKTLVDWVLERMFQPLADPTGGTAGAVGEAVESGVWSLARTVLPGVGYRLRQLEDHQLRVLAARMDEAVAERREVVPQGTLGRALDRYRRDEQGRVRPDWPTLRAKLLQQVALEGFPRLEVEVGSENRFATDGLAEVRVEMSRQALDGSQDDGRSFSFRDATEREHYIVNLLGEQQPFSKPYQYRIEARFDPAGEFGPHDPAVSEWQNGSTTRLIAEPREVYAIHDVQVGVAPTFSFTQFPNVTVELRYSARVGEVPATGRAKLAAASSSGAWRFRSFAGEQEFYEYRITYHRSPENGGDIESHWRQQADDWLFVPDPLPAKLIANIFVALPWSDITVAYMQIRYRDERNRINFDEQIDLDASVHYLRRDYPVAADGPRVISYRLTIMLTNGDLLEGSWRETGDDRLVIDRRLVDRRVIAVDAIGGSLADNRLREVQISLEVPDPAGGQPRDATTITWAAGAAPPGDKWEYLLGDPPQQSVRYSVLFIDKNGFTDRTPPLLTTADRLVVQLATHKVFA